jgi:hypothetical protein
MVPTAFVLLDALPLTPNGKIDRRALPRPTIAVEAAAQSSPTTATEHALLMLWQEVLPTGIAFIDGDFFELGGDSLLATQVAGRARRIGLPLTVEMILKYPNIRQLGYILDGSDERNAI